MTKEVQPPPAIVQSAKAAPLSEAAKKAWSVTFEPTPAMPSERLKARAELVRTAMSCGTY